MPCDSKSQHPAEANPLLQTALTVMHKLNGKMMPNTNPPVRCHLVLDPDLASCFSTAKQMPDLRLSLIPLLHPHLQVEAEPQQQPSAARGEESQCLGGRPDPGGQSSSPPALLLLLLLLLAPVEVPAVLPPQVDDLQLYQFFSRRFQSLVSAKGEGQNKAVSTSITLCIQGCTVRNIISFSGFIFATDSLSCCGVAKYY